MSGAFLTAEWRDLVMLNWEVDPALLRGRVPRGTELDAWGGKTFVSVVGFHFLRTRVLGLPLPFHVNFEEVNLRFYVRREDPGGVRRGVVFVKEIVPRWAIAWVARAVYNESYVALPMRHERGERVEYAWRTGERWNRVAARPRGEPRALAPGSHEEFVAEHYWGYSAQRDGGSVEYRVDHPPWRVRDVAEPAFDCDVASLYGSDFEPALRAPPASAFLAEGSAVAVQRGRRIC